RAGRDEAAADADEAARVRRPRDRRAGRGARRTQRHGRGRGVGGRRGGVGRLRARSGWPREVRRRPARRLRRRLPGLPWTDRLATALDRHLALVGFMGAGKTTLGEEVAERIGRRFLDLDREIEKGAGATIPEIFTRRGEEEFRELEQVAAIEVLRSEKPRVVAMGGGAVKSPAIRRALREHALTVFLEVDPGVAWKRVRGN